MLSATLTIAAKDLRSELRTKETINASLSFSLVILLLWLGPETRGTHFRAEH